MGSWRRFDINAKGVEGIQVRTIGGGIVTLLSCVCVAFLLFSEFAVWWSVDVTHRMHVDTDPVRLFGLSEWVARHPRGSCLRALTRPPPLFSPLRCGGRPAARLPHYSRGGHLIPS